MLETTHRPRAENIEDVGRGIAALIDVMLLPVTIFAGEPGFLTRNMGLPPPNWIRTDDVAVYNVRGKDAALDLIYQFTTERILDPPDPEILHRQRQCFMVLRTKKEDEAAAMERETIKAIAARNPNFRNDAHKLADEVKVAADEVAAAAPEVK